MTFDTDEIIILYQYAVIGLSVSGDAFRLIRCNEAKPLKTVADFS
jgi:hypothetical protein